MAMESATKLSKIEQAKAEFCGLDLSPRLAELAADGWQSLDEATLTIHLKWLLPLPRIAFARQIPMQLRLSLQLHEDKFKSAKPGIVESGVNQFAGLCL